MSATATAAPAPAEPATPPASSRGLTGTGTLLRFALRRDRVRLPVWIAALVLGTWSLAASLPPTAPTAADRQSVAEASSSPASLALNGPVRYLADYNYGSMLGHQGLGFVTLMVALMAVLTVVRHTRTEEETGRAELIRAGVVGRHAQLTAALSVAALASLAVGLLTAAILAPLSDEGFTAAGALLYGACYTAAGLTFAGVAAVTSQLSSHARSASGMALAVLGLSYALRAAGDSSAEGGSSWLSWLSPIGWLQRTYAYVDNRWWPLLLALALTAALTAAGYRLAAGRDVGQGIWAARLGPPRAKESLSRPLGLALRLQLPLLTGFTVALVLLGLMYGAVLGDVENFVENIEVIQDALAQLGAASVLDGFAAFVMLPLATVAAIHATMSALRPRAEETSGRAEALLGTGLSRGGWLGGHLVVAALGASLSLGAAGLAFGVSGALTTGDSGLVLKVTGAALAYAPAIWLTVAVAALLTGWAPRAAQAAWALPVGSFVIGYLGSLLDFPAWLVNLDPFSHVPQLPAADMRWTPLLVLTAVAALLTWAGLAGLRRRDLELK